MDELKSTAGSKRIYLYIMGILVVLIAAMFLWKVITVRSVEKKSQQIMTSKTEELLRLTAIPFAWTIRKEMQKEDYDQINEYLNSFIKEPHIKMVLVVKTDGTVAAATDKKLEGKQFSSFYPEELLSPNDIRLSKDKDANILLVCPIMGLNARLGTALIIYEPEKIAFDVRQ
jgi:hypothetical protein